MSKHLAILEKANLVTTVRVGRRKLHYLNPIPINEIAQRWIGQYDLGRVRALQDLNKIKSIGERTDGQSGIRLQDIHKDDP